MVNSKISGLTELTTAETGDLIPVVDVSDTTDAATGTTKKITWTNIKATLKTYFDTLYASAVSFADAETPTGAVNGSNDIFTLAHTPSPATSLIFAVNGQILSPVGVDYTLVTATVTVNFPPPEGSIIRCWYRYA